MSQHPPQRAPTAPKVRGRPHLYPSQHHRRTCRPSARSGRSLTCASIPPTAGSTSLQEGSTERPVPPNGLLPPLPLLCCWDQWFHPSPQTGSGVALRPPARPHLHLQCEEGSLSPRSSQGFPLHPSGLESLPRAALKLHGASRCTAAGPGLAAEALSIFPSLIGGGNAEPQHRCHR